FPERQRLARRARGREVPHLVDRELPLQQQLPHHTANLPSCTEHTYTHDFADYWAATAGHRGFHHAGRRTPGTQGDLALRGGGPGSAGVGDKDATVGDVRGLDLLEDDADGLALRVEDRDRGLGDGGDELAPLVEGAAGEQFDGDVRHRSSPQSWAVSRVP